MRALMRNPSGAGTHLALRLWKPHAVPLLMRLYRKAKELLPSVAVVSPSER
jgi:hypothetical protein